MTTQLCDRPDAASQFSSEEKSSSSNLVACQTIQDNKPKKPPKKLTSDQERMIVEALARGVALKELATEFNCSPSTIRRVKQRIGLSPLKTNPSYPDHRSIPYSDSNHSPSLRRLRTGGTPEAMAMDQHRIRFTKAVRLLLHDISKAEKRLNTLQNEIQQDFCKYHGAMLARWAAYEQVWAPELFEICGCETFDEVKQALTARIRRLEVKARNSMATLDRIKSTRVTIED